MLEATSHGNKLRIKKGTTPPSISGALVPKQSFLHSVFFKQELVKPNLCAARYT
ncbi:hypothetical protein BRLA_c029550 [Brevibacillus laterosporus LMG 15441]|uniref:Uncharacterized protein n=1 Tax=Brevibacillus laterosporus LMG 15441 TaxID=1042163 RepID=A0A075R425_BRELA|nr:hypothetical protein BRLA_c029550 [Brevibacillus laterosporus LMG 15441]